MLVSLIIKTAKIVGIVPYSISTIFAELINVIALIAALFPLNGLWKLIPPGSSLTSVNIKSTQMIRIVHITAHIFLNGLGLKAMHL